MNKTTTMGMMRKAVKKVHNKLMHLHDHPNSDYENLMTALKTGNGKKFIPLLIPYVEDAVEEIEKVDHSVLFTDSDMVDVADEVADKHVRHLDIVIEESFGCKCFNPTKEDIEEQEFMFAMRKKNKLKESLMAKAIRHLGENSAKKST